MQDINVRFDSVRYDEELEKPPTKVNHPPKTQAQNNPFNQPQQQQFQHSQQTQQQQQHQTISQAFHQNSPPKQDESSHDNMMPPPMGQQSNNNSNMANTASLMAAPQYRMPHKKGADTQQRKPIPFTPQNVQIISGKAIDNTNPLTETEEDKRETPRRENASNASTPTREESIKQQTQQAPPQTKEFNQPVISHPQIHTQTHTQNHPQPQPGKVINLAQKPKIGTSYQYN